LGEEALGVPGRIRYHSDDSIEVNTWTTRKIFSARRLSLLTGDIGCEHGGGVSCYGNSAKGPKQSFPWLHVLYRFWFNHDRYGLTLGGGKINNPGRYLVLLPPINGATAASGTPYFTENPGDQFKAWDASGTFDYMPSQYITFSLGVQSPRGECAVLLGTWRSYTVLSDCSYRRKYLRSPEHLCRAFTPGFEENRKPDQPVDPCQILDKAERGQESRRWPLASKRRVTQVDGVLVCVATVLTERTCIS